MQIVSRSSRSSKAVPMTKQGETGGGVPAAFVPKRAEASASTFEPFSAERLSRIASVLGDSVRTGLSPEAIRRAGENKVQAFQS